MIASLKGTVNYKLGDSIILETNGIGYRIFTPTSLYLNIKNSDEIFLFIHDHIREDSRDLYGFKEIDELTFFEKLISISGVGPKMALNIISLKKITEVKSAIEKEDIGFLTDLKGVGKKIAQKIILELKGKLVSEEIINEHDEITDALKSLGYSPIEIRETVKKIPTSVMSTEAKLREALKMLGR